MLLLSNICPVFGGDAGPPVQIERHRDGRLVDRRPKARQVIPSLQRIESKMPRLHFFRGVDDIPIGRRNLNKFQTIIKKIYNRIKTRKIGQIRLEYTMIWD